MRIKIIGVGKLKHIFFKEAVADYLKRMPKILQVEEVLVPEMGNKMRNDNESQKEIVKKAEYEGIKHEIEKSFKNGKLVKLICLEVDGKISSSKDFFQIIKGCMDSGKNELIFVVGGAYGIFQGLYKEFDGVERLSLSKMTFTHEFARVILIEQIYRVGMQLEGKRYHNF